MPSEPTSASRRPVRQVLATLAAVAIAGFGLTSATAAEQQRADDADGAGDSLTAETQLQQTLVWTADDSITEYASAPEEAAAGTTTIVFENSEATGNTSGMQHTLTFDTSSPGYNHDVDLDILAYPSDEQDGRWTAEVTLTEGTYRYICTIPGHGQMTGELVVTGGGGDDTTPPEATVTVDGETDADGAYMGAATVSLEATDDASGVALVEYQLDGGEWTEYASPVEVSDIGEHTLAYRATDVAGNVSEPGEETFTVVEGGGDDTTPPEVSLMLHGDTNADGAYLGSAEIMLTATDGNSGVDTIEYALDGGDWTAFTDPVPVTELGEHTVTYRATDVAGNVSEPAEQAFTVVQAPDDDADPPQVSAALAGEQDDAWAFVGSAVVTVTAVDEGSGVESVQYALDDGEWTDYTEPVEVDDAGEHTLAYRATDTAGNTADPGEVAFTVVADASPPACLNPDPSPTVVIDTVGTGVRNRVADGTCTIDDLIADEARWSDHEAFVIHVQNVTDGLLDDGIVSETERNKIVQAAGNSDVGLDG